MNTGCPTNESQLGTLLLCKRPIDHCVPIDQSPYFLQVSPSQTHSSGAEAVTKQPSFRHIESLLIDFKSRPLFLTMKRPKITVFILFHTHLTHKNIYQKHSTEEKIFISKNSRVGSLNAKSNFYFTHHYHNDSYLICAWLLGILCELCTY